MYLTAPISIKNESTTGRTAKVFRVVPGSDKHPRLHLQHICDITFNAKFDAVKLKNKSQYFFRRYEFAKIQKYINACLDAKKLIR